METAGKLKEATSSEFKLSFSGTSGCQYGQMVYKCQSRFDAGGPRSGKEINAGAYIWEYTVYEFVPNN